MSLITNFYHNSRAITQKIHTGMSTTSRQSLRRLGKFCWKLITLCLLPLNLRAENALVQDPEFSRCINEIMASHHWQTAAQVTDLQCPNRGINSLEGLEQFTQLQQLNLFNNHLQAFAAKPLNNLRSLNIANNQLQNLSLRDFPELQTLLVFNNQLQALETRNLPALTSLKGNNNQLLAWQYQNLPKLEKILLFNNKMPSIDIYHLPALKMMDVRQNPMPDPLYDAMNKMVGITFMHDGNAPDWK